MNIFIRLFLNCLGAKGLNSIKQSLCGFKIKSAGLYFLNPDYALDNLNGKSNTLE